MLDPVIVYIIIFIVIDFTFKRFVISWAYKRQFHSFVLFKCVSWGLTFLLHVGVLTAFYLQNKNMSAQDIFVIGISVYGMVWSKRLVVLIAKWKKQSHKKAVLNRVINNMGISLLVRMTACFTAVILLQAVFKTMDLRFSFRFIHGFSGHVIVWLSFFISAAYIILGANLMKKSLNERDIGAGIIYFMGMGLIGAGVVMGILLMLGMNVFAGLCYLACSLTFYIFAEKSGAGFFNAGKSSYLVVPSIMLGNVVSGLGLILIGLPN